MHQYFDAAVAALQGEPERVVAPPALKPTPDLGKLLNCQLAGLGSRLGRAAQRDIETPLAELEALAPDLPMTHLARHLRCGPCQLAWIATPVLCIMRPGMLQPVQAGGVASTLATALCTGCSVPSQLGCPPCSSLHHRDYSASLDHLHRFFDHTVDASLAGAGAGGQDSALGRGRLQSAALSLGAMHAQLGHVEEAMQALNETVGAPPVVGVHACPAGARVMPPPLLPAATGLPRASAARG